MASSRYFDEKLGVWVTVCPPSAAPGSNDMKHWAVNRLHGGYGQRVEVMTKAANAQGLNKKKRRRRRQASSRTM